MVSHAERCNGDQFVTIKQGGDFNRLFETLRTIVFSRDSTRAYFLEPYSEPFLINNLYVVNTAGQRIIANVSLPGAFDLAVTPDNQYIYAKTARRQYRNRVPHE